MLLLLLLFNAIRGEQVCSYDYAKQPKQMADCNPAHINSSIHLVCSVRPTTSNCSTIDWYWKSLNSDEVTQLNASYVEISKLRINSEVSQRITINKFSTANNGYYWCQLVDHTYNGSFKPSNKLLLMVNESNDTPCILDSLLQTNNTCAIDTLGIFTNCSTSTDQSSNELPAILVSVCCGLLLIVMLVLCITMFICLKKRSRSTSLTTKGHPMHNSPQPINVVPDPSYDNPNEARQQLSQPKVGFNSICYDDVGAAKIINSKQIPAVYSELGYADVDNVAVTDDSNYSRLQHDTVQHAAAPVKDGSVDTACYDSLQMRGGQESACDRVGGASAGYSVVGTQVYSELSSVTTTTSPNKTSGLNSEQSRTPANDV